MGYSQSKALWAITRASFKAIFNQPAAIVFSLLFPIIFILIFGAFGNRGPANFKIAIDSNSDTSNIFYQSLKMNPQVRFIYYGDAKSKMDEDLEKGRITAIMTLKESSDSSRPKFTVHTRTTSASANTFPAFKQTLEYTRLQFELQMSGVKTDFVEIEKPVISQVKQYRQIDFVLPGQLGFSILFSTLFGIAFTFFNLREQLVLKRFYASPVKRIHILLGIGMSRLFFQLINVVVLILFGHFFLNFTLQNGITTVLEMVALSVYMLFLLMGVGLIFSSIVKSDASIPLWINLFGFPQMMLSGTFFPIEVFPSWLQSICRVLPLTQFNDAIRKISFEGLHLTDCLKEIGIMGIWMIVIYAILSRVLKWE